MIRQEAGLSVSRFCQLTGYARASFYRHRTKASRTGSSPVVKGPWPAPVRERFSEEIIDFALAWPAWGYRKIWALMRAQGYQVSQSTVRRELSTRGLLHPVSYQRERRELAKSRREAFIDPPTRRNRVWQTDFSEYETLASGVSQISGVVDYVGKVSLCCTVTNTKTWRDAVGVIEDARSAVTDLTGHTLVEDCTDSETGEITPVIVVTDNGSCYRAKGFANYIKSRPELKHVRTRYRAPETNGVIERFFGALKYEHLYWHEINDRQELEQHIEQFRYTYNEERPHEAIDFQIPIHAYKNEYYKLQTAQTVSKS